MTKNENLLVVLMEECAEVQQATSKGIRFGLDGRYPDIRDHSNADDILTEYYQLMAVMEMCFDNGIFRDFQEDTIRDIKADKKRKVEYYFLSREVKAE